MKIIKRSGSEVTFDISKIEEAIRKAIGYLEGHGHLKVEKGYATEDGFRLDLWLKRQRKAYREGNGKVLTGERICRLEGVGMRW